MRSESQSSTELIEQRRTGSLSPLGHANLPALLNRLRDILTSRFAVEDNHNDVPKNDCGIKEAPRCPFEYMQQRLNPLKAWALMSESLRRDPTDVAPPYDTATCFGALTCRLGARLEEIPSQGQDVAEFASEAAAFACAFEKPELALQWCEQGRSLLWCQLNHLRTPFDDIQVQKSDLLSVNGQTSLGEKPYTCLALAKQWGILLQIMRDIPSFGSFLHPKSSSDLFRDLPTSGPVILINIDATRCDAIALLAGRDRPIHIPLVNFSLKKANQYRGDLLAQLSMHGLNATRADASLPGRAVRVYRSGQQSGETVVFHILRGLWTDIVKPILDALGFTRVQTSSGDLHPRIWWCPTGPLSYLPIHAAGVFCGPVRECLLDYAVSSYTPSIAALTDRVKDAGQTGDGTSGLFLTSQPNAPGTPPLPGATAEVQSINAQAAVQKARVLMLEGGDVTIEQCLKHMEEYSCIHLACHASQDASEPLHSRFTFHNGHLELGTIIQRNIKNADLAFLSACQTSVGGEKVADEAVHLASGMLAAGYRRVVGTMWAIGDRHAPEVANDFYEYLWDQGKDGCGGKVDGSRSAHALHHSIQQLRLRLDDSEKSLLTWIPYAHYGY